VCWDFKPYDYYYTSYVVVEFWWLRSKRSSRLSKWPPVATNTILLWSTSRLLVSISRDILLLLFMIIIPSAVYTRKNAQVVTNLQQTCSNAVQTTCQQDVFPACQTTVCLQLAASLLIQQTCCKLFQQFVIFLQYTLSIIASFGLGASLLWIVSQSPCIIYQDQKVCVTFSKGCILEWQPCSNLIKLQHCYNLLTSLLQACCEHIFTRKNAQVVTNLQQTCSNAVPTACQQDVFALLVPSLLTSGQQLVDNLPQGCWAQQTCYKLFQQLVIVVQFVNKLWVTTL
jgi:hypothetical protein